MGARHACMYLCASERHWFAAGFDGDDTGVEKRVYKHSVTGRRERSNCLEWRFLPRIYSASSHPSVFVRPDLTVPNPVRHRERLSFHHRLRLPT